VLNRPDAPAGASRPRAVFHVAPVTVEATRELRQAVLRPHQTLAEIAAGEAPGAFAVGAFEAGRLVSVGMIVPDGEPGGWRIRGMATAPDARGRGAGTRVLDALIEHARAEGARRIWCNARVPARRLYERAGLRIVSEAFELPQIGPHFVMEMRLEDSGG
jgi:ribosomal protein S18 acetylase RimI-like enzyme